MTVFETVSWSIIGLGVEIEWPIVDLASMSYYTLSYGEILIKIQIIIYKENALDVVYKVSVIVSKSQVDDELYMQFAWENWLLL